MGGGFHNDLIAALVAVGGLAGLIGLALYAVHRAKAAKMRRIAELEAPEPPKKRPALRPEDVEAEEEPAPRQPKALPEEAKEAPTEAETAESQPVEEAKAPAPVIPIREPEAPAAVLPVEKPRRPEQPAKRRDVSALVPGLERTRSSWVKRLGQLFAGKRELDPALLEEIEKVLLTADIGVRTSQKLLAELRESLDKKSLKDPSAVWSYLRKRSAEILTLDAPPVDFASAKPFVLLIIGVNGSGKTTTIGKLASKLKSQGKSVLLAAGDTFRAAAVEQLEIWATKVGAPVVRGKEGGDPSSVIFDGVKKARAEGVDVVIADTAGRLHTKSNLMEELQKVRRVTGKAMEGAPHETWLVIDSTNGQNAIAQAQEFTKGMSVSGIVLTKLDGTAKGGVILGIADQLRIPVRFIGVGERVDDLREFDAEDFVEALFGEAQNVEVESVKEVS
jgi:fused signal recognition particle receptor